jgi:hypothetical protein
MALIKNRFKRLEALSLSLLLIVPSVYAQQAGSLAQSFVTLRDHIGATEKVHLDIYFIGFPAELQADLKAGVGKTLNGLAIEDAKPWWIPNIPKYGASAFATAPAPGSLPSGDIPPDGLLRYEPNSMQKQVAGGTTTWVPQKEIGELVSDWHQNADIVNYVEHAGSYRGVPWRIQGLQVHFLPTAELNSLLPLLTRSQHSFKSANPQTQVTLYSYNVLMDWLGQFNHQPDGQGGATLVFLNLAALDSGQPYAFYAEPAKDAVPAIGVADSEVQYSAANASSAANQAVASAMATVLHGGLTQPKMLAAMDVKCADTSTSAGSGIALPGMKPSQPLCSQWSLDPIRNLAGNDGRRIFVSDATTDVTAYQHGGISRTAFLSQVQQNAFELYRYGVLAPTIKANNVYSEAYELRTLVVDLRYGPKDLCILSALKQGLPSSTAASQCKSPSGFPTEQTYQVSDVFDANLAEASLSQFNPGNWEVTLNNFPFGVQPNGTVDPVMAVQTKALLRQALNQPVVTNPATGQTVTLTHPPFYRTMMVPDAQNNLHTISSSWENGIDPVSAMTLLTGDAASGGLGIYTSIWPEASVTGAKPYHETGKRTVKPLALFLTPPPDGPLGEKWGAFPFNLDALAGLGILSEYGGGGWWISGGGNEEGGGLLRRDFSWMVPQYFAGPSRGNGEAAPTGVMPDGTVQPFPLGFLTARALEIGAPHWCNEFDAADPAARASCRSFVKSTTTLQAIETLQHGLGYMHTAEPRYRYHFDGTQSSIARLYQLLSDPSDTFGQLLYQDVNMYTTAGLSTVWSQSVSEWNGTGPHAGMQAGLFRSHAREEMSAAETALTQATAAFQAAFSKNSQINGVLQMAVAAHDAGLRAYDNWDYRGVLFSAEQSLALISKSMALMGQPGSIHDPLQIKPLAPELRFQPAVDSAQIEKALKSLTVDRYKQAVRLLSAH